MTGWRRNLAIAVAAVAGLVLAAALTTAAGSLSRQSVGLSSEPPTAGRGLSPVETATATPTAKPPRPAKPRPTRTPRPSATPAPTVTAAPTSDDNSGSGGGGDSSGRGRGRGRGRGADD
jgi:hypothetical protein